MCGAEQDGTSLVAFPKGFLELLTQYTIEK